jgi:hypothetical protein
MCAAHASPTLLECRRKHVALCANAAGKPSNSTLIVVPPSLLAQWAAECLKSMQPSVLSICVYNPHKTRLTSSLDAVPSLPTPPYIAHARTNVQGRNNACVHVICAHSGEHVQPAISAVLIAVSAAPSLGSY